MRISMIPALILISLLPLKAQSQSQANNPAGAWRCVSNSPYVSIDLQMQINPNQTLYGQGTIIYLGTNRIDKVRGNGRWVLNPPDPGSNVSLYRFQIQPQDGNHAIFSIFVRPTSNPRQLYNKWQNPQTGDIVETSCQRRG